MVIKRTFATKLEAVDAFGLSNELLRPRGFQLGKGTPPRSQSWSRGAQPGENAKSVFKVPQTIELEFDKNRVNVTATAEASGRKATSAQRMLTAYAQGLELLLSSGATPEAAGAMAKAAEKAIRIGSIRKIASVCAIALAVVGGGGYAMTMVKGFPSPMKWLSSKSAAKGSASTSGASASSHADASGSKTRKSPPVIVVRKAGAQTSAAKASDPNP